MTLVSTAGPANAAKFWEKGFWLKGPIVVADPSRFLDDRAMRRTIEDVLGTNGVDLRLVAWEAGYGPGDDTDAPYHRQWSCFGGIQVTAAA